MKSSTDPIIPANYISWRQLVTAERLNMERTKTAIETTFARIQAKQIEKEFKNLIKFAQHYNNASNNLITNKEVNYLLTIGTIEPIAHQIKLFVSSRISRTRTDCKGGNVYLVYDFGILTSNYEFWKKNGVPKQTSNRGRAKEHYTDKPSDNGRTKIDLPKGEWLARFKDGIAFANSISEDKTTIPKVLMAAAVEYMNARPQIFAPQTVEVADNSAIRVKDNETLTVQIPSELMRWLSAALARYNSANVQKLSYSQFAELAFTSLLERIDVKYSNPELAHELKEKTNDKQKTGV